MKERLKDYLSHGEEILWNSRPETFEIMDKTHKKAYTLRGVISVLVTLVLIVAYILLAIANSAGIKAGVIVVLVIAGAYLVVSPFLDSKKLGKSVDYVLTNEKLIIVTPSDARSVKLDAIPVAKLSTDEDGHTSLLCGEDALELSASKRRGATLTGALLNQDTMICERFVMYAIADVAGLKKAAVGYLTITE